MNELMLQEMESQAAMLAEAIVDLRAQATSIGRGDMSRIVLAGSGDSGHAAMAVEDLLLRRLRLPVWALPSIAASRYPRTGRGDLTVAISVSGEVIRTLEVARRARHRESTTVAVVANGESRLARECDVALVMPKPITRSTPHTRDYAATLLALGVLGERLSGAPWAELDQWVGAVGTLVTRSLEWAASIEVSPAEARVWFLGSGPDRGTAAYGALKFWEAGGAWAWWDDLEEFAHGSQLQARPGDDVVLFATGPASSRAAEMIPGILRMGLRPLVITDGAVFPGVPLRHQFELQPRLPEDLIGFYSCVPVQAIAYQYACARHVDVTVPMAGAPFGQTYEDVHNEWMRKSKLEVEG